MKDRTGSREKSSSLYRILIATDVQNVSAVCLFKVFFSCESGTWVDRS